jgi:hypothetical protein
LTRPRPRKGDSGVVITFRSEGHSMSPSNTKHAPGRIAPSMSVPPAVFHDRPLRHELHRSLAAATLSAEEIAQGLGISPSYLRRAVLTGQAAVRFPADLLAPFMHLCNDYSPLAQIASECGHIVVPLAKARRAKSSPVQSLSENAAGFHALMADLIAFFERPAAGSAPDLRARLRKHASAMVALDQALRDFKQMDLPLEETA